MEKSTWLATPNIAVVKYWGKRDSFLNLPDNGSVSVTMDEALKTITTVEFDERLESDLLVLNGRRASAEETARAKKVLDAIRKKAGIFAGARIFSRNNFPTAAGIASSASGFAALACAASDAAGLSPSKRELSIFARLGSGSACRSVFGGFVEWKRGSRQDGSDSYAVQIAPADHWKEIRNVIAITNPERKKIGSARGMEITSRTSKLYPQRVRLAPKVIRMMKRAIRKRELETFLLLTMRESSHLHAVMLDSFPPIIYLNDISRQIMDAVLGYNEARDEICAGYTFDAGPNAHVYTTQKHAGEVRRLLSEIEGVRQTIVCKVGRGPRKLGSSEALF
ncbi:MAG: diphosphomevalonate decarboxylase [Candidatus Micrarchaeota archaeon]|nr:diphosphomevalonate decarboxylase [Candidatus Micrarchaeota archaeon]